MDKKDIAAVLEEIAVLLDLLGENPFRANAFRNAGRALENLEADLGVVVAEGRLTDVPRIGKAIAKDITELVETGHLGYVEELRAQVPDGLLEIVRIPGLGPRKVKSLHEQLKVETLDDLDQACANGRVAELKGFGKTSEQKIRKGIQNLRRYKGRHHIDFARERADMALALLGGDDRVRRCEVCGSLRRWRETAKDVDIVASVAAADRPGVVERFLEEMEPEEVIARGETKTSVRLDGGLSLDLRLVEDAEYPAALNYFTGSKEHNTVMRGLAKKKGLRLNEYGLFRVGDGEGGDGEPEALPIEGEEDIYAALGLRYVPPELREDAGEFEAAIHGGFPELVEEKDLRGLLHVHSTWSDGRATLEEMVRGAVEWGFSYIGISDHSQAAFYARGLDPDRLEKQREEIESIRGKYPGIEILQGSEVDILPDGSLDFPDEVLARLDFVVASIHSSLGQPEDEMTQRVIRALQSPHVTILGHPTARLLLQREPIRISLPPVLEEAAKRGVAVEINANPRRLDLDWRVLRAAKAAGTMLSINPDAHSRQGIWDVRYGVGIARKGWLEKGDILNTRTVEEFRTLAKRT